MFDGLLQLLILFLGFALLYQLELYGK